MAWHAAELATTSANAAAAILIMVIVAGHNSDRGSALMFLPALLPAGIEPADAMIQFRNKTYSVSYERRHAR